MKTFTERERASIAEYLVDNLPAVSTHRALEMSEQICNWVNAAEGEPAGSGDKYLDAKNEIIQRLKEANTAIKEAWDLKLTIELGLNQFYTIGENPNCPKVALTKIYKEF